MYCLFCGEDADENADRCKNCAAPASALQPHDDAAAVTVTPTENVEAREPGPWDDPINRALAMALAATICLSASIIATRWMQFWYGKLGMAVAALMALVALARMFLEGRNI